MEFEKKLSQLEDIVRRLEDKNVGLEDGILLFEQGLSLTKECLESLCASQSRIEVVKEQLNQLLESDKD